MKKRIKIIVAVTVAFILTMVTVTTAVFLGKENEEWENSTNETSKVETDEIVIPPIENNTETTEDEKPDLDVGELTKNPKPEVGKVTIEHGSLEDLENEK